VLGAGWVERNAGKDEVQERRFEKVIADAHELADEQRTWVGKPLESCRNEEKDHEASGLRVDRAEKAEVCRGI